MIDTLEARKAEHEVLNLDGFLFFDLEVHPDGKLLKVGAVLNGRKFERSGSFSTQSVLSELSEFSKEAQAIVGHNILQHDLRILNRGASGNALSENGKVMLRDALHVYLDRLEADGLDTKRRRARDENIRAFAR